MSASPANVMLCTSRRSMRTASWSDAPSAIDNGINNVVAVATAATGSGHEINAFNTTVPAVTAAATTTPHATHCRRARS